MPELPDLQVFAINLSKRFAGKKLQQIKLVNGKSLKDNEDSLNKQLQGAVLKEVYRSGKELRFLFSNNAILGMHLMLHGNLFEFEAKNDHKHTIAEFHFEGKGLALTDHQGAANIKLNPEERDGIDALSEDLTFDQLKKALQSRSNIKVRITNQDVIKGIGNAYADEILWEARIAPLSISNKIPDDKIKALNKAIKRVLTHAETQILKSHPDIIQGEVRNFLKIHNSEKHQSPSGAEIKVDKKGRITYYTDEQELFA